MTVIEGHHEDGCLMCAVRALTEGRAKEWMPDLDSLEEVTGVVLRQGTQPSAYGAKLFVEIWLGGTERRRITGYAAVLESLIENAELQVGDTVTIRYTGLAETKKHGPDGEFLKYKTFELEVQRGHR